MNENILKHIPKNKDNWQDKDTVMRNILFQLIIDYVVNEDGLYMKDAGGIFDIEHIRKLYEQAPKLDDILKSYQKLYDLYEYCRKNIDNEDCLNEHNSLYHKDTEIMMEIVKYRQLLWK